MNDTILSSLPGHHQLRRLVNLRNVSIATQLVALITVWKILALELNWSAMLLTIFALATVNVLSSRRLRSNNLVSSPELFVQLCIDVLALSILLYHSGGSTNPFISLYVLPLVIAAATLPSRYTWGMAALTVACYSLLMFYYVPLPQDHHNHGGGDNAFNSHVIGMWLGFVLTAIVVAYFVVQMAQAVRKRDEMLTQAREEILRNERIVALGTQAAGAAHELGTPLATMAVVVGELQDETGSSPAWRDALTTLDEQVRGCKRILDKILANAQRPEAVSLQPPEQLLAEVLDEWQLLRPTAQYEYSPQISSSSDPVGLIKADTTLRAALMNLLNNAADAAPQAIQILTHSDASRFVMEIYDHGKGLSEEAATKAGSAFFTTKKEGRGVGLLLANATVERMGGTVRLFNRDGGGATTQLIMPFERVNS
ncbi:MAG: ATP-binding protein [Gallionella sp.]|nr:HAMP domain-containing histidine kinase [Gallionella sp.]